jgi:hypothetical protein
MYMRAFYGSRFSKYMTVTPEGFLICHNVPISRTGWYEYLGDEIGTDEHSGKVVKVSRTPEEVFSDGAIASFEGKPVTDEHPQELVTPENATRYAKGAVQNVRQGTGQDSDLLLADLVIYDQTLINEVQDGKREVSCGYDCVYVDNGDSTYSQQQISGNHVAVVISGRAGNRVAIKDGNPKTEGETKMGKIKLPKKAHSRTTDFLAAIGLKQFALDADPEDIKEAVDAMAEERETDDDGDQVQGTEQKANDDAQDPALVALQAQVEKLTELVHQLAQGGTQDESPEKAIDDAISELEKASTSDDGEEESHTVPADTMDDEGPVSDPEDRPKNPIPGADNAYKVEALKAIKPILAKIPDPKERKKATDAALASIKGMKPSKNTYGQMAKRTKKPATNDTQAKAVDHSQLGKEIAKKYNPHYKEQ